MPNTQNQISPLRVGIAGLGTVGIGVIKIITQHAEMLASRTGRTIEISAVSARSKGKDRGVDLSAYAFEEDPVALAKRDDVDLFIEVIGGDEGPAKDAVVVALQAGKDVVTANKAMLAIHGHELAQLAESKKVSLRYEAAVAGGIPVIKSLTEGLAGNKITRIMGVMNGTCNYILTRMEETRQGYNALFNECAELGYLEADPNLDVGGIDAGHKLAILSSIAYGTQVDFSNIHLEGIQEITLQDIEHVAEMGYKIKLLGVTQLTENGLEQRMTPCLVPASSPLGQLSGGTNMVVIEGDSVEQVVLRGPGAGEGPTASAVMGDVIDIARGIHLPVFGIPAEQLSKAQPASCTAPAPYYLRIPLHNKAGALAQMATALGDCDISIAHLHQYEDEFDAAKASVLIVTEACSKQALQTALGKMEGTSVLAGTPIAIRIEAV